MAKAHYNHQEIEAKWRNEWQKTDLYLTDPDHVQEKFYCLDMFPYPSGSGLHVGHWRGYVLSDFYARYWRLMGKNVLHPMGFDSFGLPAENAAIKAKSHPKEFTDTAIKTFRKQLDQIGAAYDWTKQVVTSDPNYYRWTQWLFLRFFKHGLAEKRISLVNWCPNDQTVLANEQVVNGKCERCGHTVTKKELSQWYLKTTEYAQALLEGLDQVEWPEHVKTLQRNWIGRSNGTTINFAITNHDETISVFTTRVDTLFGVTAVVLAPEHPIAEKLVIDEQKKAFTKYQEMVAAKTNIDRQQEAETAKTAFFTGSYVFHPLTKEKIPVWLADYVLLEYGTGAVMAVPAHDQRDYQFATTHNIPIKFVVASNQDKDVPFTGIGTLVESGEFSGLESDAATEKILEKLARTGEKTTIYRLRDWLVSRQRYWGPPIPIVYDPDGHPHAVKDEHLPLVLPEDVDFTPGGESPVARSKEYAKRAEKLYGEGWHFETDTLDTFVDSSWYYLRYLTPADTEKAFDPELVKKWLPVDLYIGGIEHATLHLLYARFVTRFLADKGYIDKSITEPFRQLFNIGMVTLHGAKMSKSKGNVITPDELVRYYGTDALRGYELFLGPLDIEAEWNPRGINGVHRFLIKLFNLGQEEFSDQAEAGVEQLFAQYLQAIEPMIKDFRLNTVLAEAMKFTNIIEKKNITGEIFQQFLISLSPIFPFLTEELWHQLGNKESIFTAKWPEIKVVASDNVEVSVRFNHKHIGLLVAKRGLTKEELTELVKNDSQLGNKLGDTRPDMVIHVVDKFIDYVVTG